VEALQIWPKELNLAARVENACSWVFRAWHSRRLADAITAMKHCGKAWIFVQKCLYWLQLRSRAREITEVGLKRRGISDLPCHPWLQLSLLRTGLPRPRQQLSAAALTRELRSFFAFSFNLRLRSLGVGGAAPRRIRLRGRFRTALSASCCIFLETLDELHIFFVTGVWASWTKFFPIFIFL